MARKKVVAIDENCLKDFSNEILERLNENYRLVCCTNKTIDSPYVKVVQKKPAAFATLRKNSICFVGDVALLRTKMLMRPEKNIALDFDGVINSYVSGWTGVSEVIDPPVDGIVDFINDYKNKFKNMVVYSSRGSSSIGILTMENYLKRIGVDIDTFVDEIPEDYLLIDDRVIDYTKIDDIVAYLDNFESWTKNKKIA